MLKIFKLFYRSLLLIFLTISYVLKTPWKLYCLQLDSSNFPSFNPSKIEFLFIGLLQQHAKLKRLPSHLPCSGRGEGSQWNKLKKQVRLNNFFHIYGGKFPIRIRVLCLVSLFYYSPICVNFNVRDTVLHELSPIHANETTYTNPRWSTFVANCCSNRLQNRSTDIQVTGSGTAFRQ